MVKNNDSGDCLYSRCTPRLADGDTYSQRQNGRLRGQERLR